MRTLSLSSSTGDGNGNVVGEKKRGTSSFSTGPGLSSDDHNNNNNSNSGNVNATTTTTTTTATIVRPTEGQLRWAQFHHKRRAVTVRRMVQRLYETPATVEEAKAIILSSSSTMNEEGGEEDDSVISDGGHCSDGSSSSSSRSCTSGGASREDGRLRPRISKGRRVLLKRSKRRYQRRHEWILLHGYRRFTPDNDDDDDDDDEDVEEVDNGDDDTDTEQERRQRRQQQQREVLDGENPATNGTDVVICEDKVHATATTTGGDNLNNDNDEQEYHHPEKDGANEDAVDADDDDRALEEIFMARPERRVGKGRRRPPPPMRRRGGGRGAGTRVDSFRRFQAARHAMVEKMNIGKGGSASATPPITATKRWTRSEQHIAAATTLMNQDFLEYRWGIRRRQRDGTVVGRNQVGVGQRSSAFLLSAYLSQNNMKPLDGGATWMTHLPKHVQYLRESPYYHSVADLPPGAKNSSSSSADDGSEGNISSSTLAMRTPGPQKFSQLVAFVQQKLIERERLVEEERRKAVEEARLHQRKMRLRESHPTTTVDDDGHDPNLKGKSRTRQMAESLESATAGGSGRGRNSLRNNNVSSNNKIREMARHLEGKGDAVGDQTPRMKLHDDFLGSTPSLVGEKKQQQRRRSRYIPRMRLREFTYAFSNTKNNNEADSDNDEDNDGIVRKDGIPRMRLVTKFEATPEDEEAQQQPGEGNPPRMRLRKFQAGDHREDDDAHEGVNIDPNNHSPPRMKLRGSLLFDRDEKKVSDDDDTGGVISPTTNPSRTSVERLSKQFVPQSQEERRQEQHRSGRQQDQDYPRPVRPLDPSSSTSPVDSDYFAQIRSQMNLVDPSDPNMNVTDMEMNDNAQTRNADHQQLQSDETPTGSDLSHSAMDHPQGSSLSETGNRGRNSPSIHDVLSYNLNTILESHATQEGEMFPADNQHRNSNVPGRASDFLNKLRNKEENSEEVEREAAHHGTTVPMQQQVHHDDSRQNGPAGHATFSTLLPSPSEDSHDALAAYRKKRLSMGPDDVDDKSSASSFRPLPEQIRDAVHKSKASPSLTPAGERYNTSPLSSTHQRSPPRPSSAVHSTMSELSTERYREAHGQVLQSSALLGEFDRDSVIDTDGTQSEASMTGLDPSALASLMMSPDVLQKRLGQAIRAIEQRKWDQVSYLINANPWLVEMKELTTNQYLLHKLAFFGGGSTPAPDSLTDRLLEKFPAAVYKFDQDGNVPLHLAAAAGNISLIQALGDSFPSGASIRNEDGMLPLHFAIASYADDFDDGVNEERDENRRTESGPLQVVKTVLDFFPRAISIADNDGNLPLHVAAECLNGGVGVDIIYLLMDEADRQLQDPYGARFHNTVKLEDMVNDDIVSTVTMSTERESDTSNTIENEISCNAILNNSNDTPLLTAIRAQKGWEMIEAIVTGTGGRTAALRQDGDKNNALHLLVGEYQDPAAALSILKVAPDAATARNANGVLPIEVACMQMMPEEVILAIACVDLPINIEDRDGITVHENHGESWTFLTCESDDHFVDVVNDIVAICSFQQLRELCFLQDKVTGNTIIARATPMCRELLKNSLRFLGRFEFLGNGPLSADPDRGLKVFDALDFGGNATDEGKRVLLECYATVEGFESRVSVGGSRRDISPVDVGSISRSLILVRSQQIQSLINVNLDNSFVEEVDVFVEYVEDAPQHHCVSIERPQLTLDKVVSGMHQNGGYTNDIGKRQKYSAKVCSVLRLIGKALRHLHTSGVVHGNVCMETCGKFDDSSWKLLDRLEVQVIGATFDCSGFHRSFPPESIELAEDAGAICDSDDAAVSFRTTLIVDPSIDVWSFGQTCYETLVGKPLIESDINKSPSEDMVSMLQIMEWDESNMQEVFSNLLDAGIEESGADLITSCLFPRPQDRPSSMDEVLDHPFWNDMRKHRSKKRLSRSSMRSSTVDSPTKSQVTEVETYEV